MREQLIEKVALSLKTMMSVAEQRLAKAKPGGIESDYLRLAKDTLSQSAQYNKDKVLKSMARNSILSARHTRTKVEPMMERARKLLSGS